MIRFFAAPEDISDVSIALSADDTAHIHSLRLRPDEFFIVCDGNGTDYICRLGKRGGDPVAEIVDSRQAHGEPSVTCNVFIAYAKGERLDYAVQKSVELGARCIALFKSHRCIAVPRDVHKKTERLKRIALETAKQCGRGIIPDVYAAGSFEEAVSIASQSPALPLFFYECEGTVHIGKVLEKHFAPLRKREQYETTAVSIVTGPEGGFEPHEAEYAKSKGMFTVSLGPRILRCETAPVVALSAVMYHTGNL